MGPGRPGKRPRRGPGARTAALDYIGGPHGPCITCRNNDKQHRQKNPRPIKG